jgi:hypothetical protein
MEKQESLELLANAMGILSSEAEIEANIAEASGISREEYNHIIEFGLELPDCIKKYRENNKKRMFHEERLIKQELKESGELLSKPALIRVFADYPDFQEDYELLKTNGFFSETQNGLKWEKSKQSLAEYFGYLPLPHSTKNRPWKNIEILFNEQDLKNSFSSNGNAHRKLLSKDYEELTELKIPL